MKGMSTIIAIIILVVITIGLIATAYLYFLGIVYMEEQKPYPERCYDTTDWICKSYKSETFGETMTKNDFKTLWYLSSFGLLKIENITITNFWVHYGNNTADMSYFITNSSGTFYEEYFFTCSEYEFVCEVKKDEL